MTTGIGLRAHFATVALISLTIVGACTRARVAVATPPAPIVQPPSSPAALASREWPAARDAASTAMVHGEFARADSNLRAFAARYPGTPAASETEYWRALLRLDPAADNVLSRDQVHDARVTLDGYLAAGQVRPHYAEALTLRRLAAHLDSLRATTDAARPTLGTQASRDSLRVRDEEMTRLRAELDQTKAELDRIRRRLSPPRP